MTSMLDPNGFIAFMHSLPAEASWGVLLLLCFGAVLAMLRAFGAAGLYAYIVIAVIGANLQVLKPVQFTVFADPVALGTILFASTYLATDILAEHYGKAAARKGVFLGFAGFLFWTLLMLVTLGFPPVTPEQAGDALAWAVPVHGSMAVLFTPAPIFFVAGMTAYLISQLNDVWLYDRLRQMTAGRSLWLRNNASTAVSALIDNIVFSLLAWIILAPEPLPFMTVVTTYILGTYALRLLVAVLDTPFIYLAARMRRPDDRGLPRPA
jgi:uncharacterized integral membrane protein (TIGR00697 family)